MGHAWRHIDRPTGAMTSDIHAFPSCRSACFTRSAVLPQQDLYPKGPAWNEPNVALCYSIRPPPARRRRFSTLSKQLGRDGWTCRRLSPACNFLSALLLYVLLLCPATSAEKVYGGSEIFPRELLFDQSPPPTPDLSPMLLNRRHNGSPSSSILFTGSPTATGSIQMATSAPPATLPRPFDTSIGNNFTSSSCPNFFGQFLSNKAFQDCLPFSLLLQTSNSFFSISKSLLRLTQTLDVSCNVNFNQCSALMASLAEEIQQDTVCGQDLGMQNPVVTQAYNGFIAYPSLYHAGCLTDTDGNYCFADAVTNASSPSSSYVYYLPLGVQLPGGARPTCNQCLQKTMTIFAQTASNASQPLSLDYAGAAQQIQMNCGPTFVEMVVASSRASSSITTSYGLTGLILLATLLMNLF